MLRTPIHNGRSPPPPSPRYGRKRDVKLTRKHSQFPSDGSDGRRMTSESYRRRGRERSLSDSIFMNHIDDLVMHLITGGK